MNMIQRLTRVKRLERAATLVGGQRSLAALLNVGERSVRSWLGADRRISDGVMLDTAAVLHARAVELEHHARTIVDMVREQLGQVDQVKAALADIENPALEDLIDATRKAWADRGEG